MCDRDIERYRIEAEAVSKDSAYTLRQVIEDNVDLRLIAFDPATTEAEEADR